MGPSFVVLAGTTYIVDASEKQFRLVDCAEVLITAALVEPASCPAKPVEAASR